MTHSSKEYTFVKFKSAIRNYGENEKSRCTTIKNSSDGKDKIIKVSGANNTPANPTALRVRLPLFEGF